MDILAEVERLRQSLCHSLHAAHSPVVTVLKRNELRVADAAIVVEDQRTRGIQAAKQSGGLDKVSPPLGLVGDRPNQDRWVVAECHHHLGGLLPDELGVPIGRSPAKGRLALDEHAQLVGRIE